MAKRKQPDGVYGPYRDRERWRVVVITGGKRASRCYDTEARALEVVTELRRKVEQQVWIDDALERFRRHIEATGIKKVTVYTTMRRLQTLIGPHADSLDRLTPSKAQKLYDAMRMAKDGDEPRYSVDYHRNALSAAKRFGRWCAAERLLRADPFEKVEGVGKRRRGKEQLGIDEARRLYAACLADSSEEATAVLCALMLGLRASEIIWLQARDIDDGGTKLRVRKSKTEAGKRLLDLPADLSARLSELAEVGPLFAGRTRYWVHYHCRRMCTVAGVPQVPPHGLRGTHATVATKASATPEMVQRALGHTSTDVGARHYIDGEATDSQRGQAALVVIQGGR